MQVKVIKEISIPNQTIGMQPQVICANAKGEWCIQSGTVHFKSDDVSGLEGEVDEEVVYEEDLIRKYHTHIAFERVADPVIFLPNYTRRHSDAAKILRFFEWNHLEEPIRAIGFHFSRMAYELANLLPEDPELFVGLRKMLEAKDCFVRAALQKK